MSNHQFRLTSLCNISFDHIVDSGIPEDEWAEMSEHEQDDARGEALADNVEISDVES